MHNFIASRKINEKKFKLPPRFVKECKLGYIYLQFRVLELSAHLRSHKYVRALSTLRTLKTLGTLGTLGTLETLKTLRTLKTLKTLRTLKSLCLLKSFMPLRVLVSERRSNTSVELRIYCREGLGVAVESAGAVDFFLRRRKLKNEEKESKSRLSTTPTP